MSPVALGIVLREVIARNRIGYGIVYLQVSRGVARRDHAFPTPEVPPSVVEEVLERYPRINFKAEFRNLLVEHCRHNPAAQVLNWTDDVARTAGCTLQGQPIPTASKLMSSAPYDE